MPTPVSTRPYSCALPGHRGEWVRLESGAGWAMRTSYGLRCAVTRQVSLTTQARTIGSAPRVYFLSECCGATLTLTNVRAPGGLFVCSCDKCFKQYAEKWVTALWTEENLRTHLLPLLEEAGGMLAAELELQELLETCPVR